MKTFSRFGSEGHSRVLEGGTRLIPIFDQPEIDKDSNIIGYGVNKKEADRIVCALRKYYE